MLKPTIEQTKLDNRMYITQAALEYLISILVSGSFLATLTNSIGISDSFTGILSSVISLGCLFQLLSIPIRPKNIKKFVIRMSLINQVLFLLLYITPTIGISTKYKTLIFTLLIFSAYLTYYIAHPQKINWLMSTVENSKRGIFTANKEIISLISGALFSFLAGAVIDKFINNGKSNSAFIICALIITTLSAVHTLCLINTSSPPTNKPSKTKKLLSKFQLFRKNKKLLNTAITISLYYISTYISVPFFGAYQIKDLGLSLKTISLLALLESISRITISRKWGRYADKFSFEFMIEKCFYFIGIAYVCTSFAFSNIGIVAFAAYYILRGIAMGGINSAIINLVYDSTPPEERSDALAICQAAAGVIGFIATLSSGVLVDFMQNNRAILFNGAVSAPQLLSLFSAVFVVAAIIHLKKCKQ